MPEFGQARAVQIDIDGRFIGMRYPTEVNLVGDAAATLTVLLPKITRNGGSVLEGDGGSNVAEWWSTMDMQAALEAKPVNPMRVVSERSRLGGGRGG